MSTYDKFQEEMEAMLTPTPRYTTASLSRMKKDELKSLCKKRGLSEDGTKRDLVSRLMMNADIEPLEATSNITYVRKEEDGQNTEGAKGKRV